jgi:hypothetical protein
MCEQTILAEVLVLRTVLLSLFFKLANAEHITADEMQRLIERVDVHKLKKRLQESRKQAIRNLGRHK